MPSGPGGRKKPFSGKQKKQQLQAKRDRQQGRDSGLDPGEARRLHTVLKQQGAASSSGTSRAAGASSSGGRIQVKNEFTTTLEDANSLGCKFFEVRAPTTKADAGRYALMFRKESKEELNRQKQESRKIIKPVLEEYLECKIEDFFSPELDIPIRPTWSYDITREQLERNEYKYFHEYLKNIDAKFQRSDLSYFELNLETWRQLWRVLEMSDILLCVVDIRFPPLLFPPKLYDYVCKELGKNIILVLNKIDLCPAPLVLAWKDYFKTNYPELHVLCFTSFPSYNVCGSDSPTALHGKRRKGKMRMAAEGALELYKVCASLVQGEVDLDSWKAKILEEMTASGDADEDDEVKIEQVITEKVDTGFYDFKKFSNGILTIGCLGQPNVGKSSLINALMGKKVVSVSRTPGHTKHFQTIFLTPNVRLCDCPGLIFPSKIPKALQVLCGSFPIAQLREPYSTVKYLAERLDLIKILKISHPEGESEWCALDIADGWAEKRGYLTAKAARLDSYRGANHILRLALEGRIRLCLYPPGYYASKDQWNQDPRVSEILSIQAKSQDMLPNVLGEIQDLSEDEDNESAPQSEDEEDPESDTGSKGESEKDNANSTKESSNSSSQTSKKKASAPVVKVTNKFALLLDDSDDDDE